jgi:succinate dehydrogenase hydrophobic anchor subunit
MTVVFAILALLGFIFWFLATWPQPSPPTAPWMPWMERLARGFFLAAAVVFFWGALTHGG